MSNQKDLKAKQQIIGLANAITPVIKAYLETLSVADISYILKNYKEFLKLNLVKDFEESKRRPSALPDLTDLFGNNS